MRMTKRATCFGLVISEGIHKSRLRRQFPLNKVLCLQHGHQLRMAKPPLIIAVTLWEAPSHGPGSVLGVLCPSLLTFFVREVISALSPLVYSSTISWGLFHPSSHPISRSPYWMSSILTSYTQGHPMDRVNVPQKHCFFFYFFVCG